MDRKCFYLIGLDSKKSDLLSIKNQTNMSLFKFGTDRPTSSKIEGDGQIDILKSLYYNKTLNANVANFSNRNELVSI